MNRRFGTLALVALSISLVMNWAALCLVLWFAYDMGFEIDQGYYPRAELLTSMWKMGLIITTLTGVVWLLADRKKTKRRVWNVAWKTCVILTLYVAIVLIRRNLWDQSQGVIAYAMFLPIVGHVNGMFLAEDRWIAFLTQVIPFAGLVSGGLYLLWHWIEVFWADKFTGKERETAQ